MSQHSTTLAQSAPSHGRTAYRRTALLRARVGGEPLRLCCLAMVVPVCILALETLVADPWRFNDYYVYWLAGKIVASGGNPYDVSLLTEFAINDGRSVRLGGPYSYLPPFAALMIPLSALPFELSAWIFSVVSLAVFGPAVAILLTRAPVLDRLGSRARSWMAALSGAYPPISGSLVVGQINLIVFGLLALGFLPLLSRERRPRARRRFLAGSALGLAAVVKLVPGLLVVPLLLAHQWTAATALILATLGSLALSRLAAPVAFGGSAELAGLFQPDSYWTNQSVNGWVSRMLLESDRTRALTPGLFPIGFAVAACIVLLAVLTALVLWRSRAYLRTPVGLGLGLALALIAGSAGAPKNSIWNHAPALLAVWAVLWPDRPATGSGSLDRLDRGLLVVWMTGPLIQQGFARLPGLQDGPWAGLCTILISGPFYGLLALWILIARRLWVGSCPARGHGLPSIPREPLNWLTSQTRESPTVTRPTPFEYSETSRRHRREPTRTPCRTCK